MSTNHHFHRGVLGVVAALLLASCGQDPIPRTTAEPTPAAHDTVTPLEAPPPATKPGTLAGPDEASTFSYGETQPVPSDSNAQTKSVAEALHDGTHPERLSPLIAPAAFDLAAYQRNPKAYLNVVEPGRVFQVAQPGAQVPRIVPLGPLVAEVAQGGKTVLQVHVSPGMPVTFTSFDLGRFTDNQLTSITVAANDHGIAQVTFEGASGTIGDVNILAACPVTSGQLTYRITVTRPPEKLP